MTDKELQDLDSQPQKKKGQQSLIVLLLAAIVLLLVGVIVLFFYQQNQNQQFQRLQAATAYFDKLEQEEKAAAEQERLKAELARAEAARAEAARQAEAQRNTYNPCKHVYHGKEFETEGRFLWTRTTTYWTVVGFSSSSGKATVRQKYNSSISQEIYCSQIPD